MKAGGSSAGIERSCGGGRADCGVGGAGEAIMESFGLGGRRRETSDRGVHLGRVCPK